MPTIYMMIWSTVMILLLSIGRVRSVRRVLALVLVTAVTLFLADAIFLQLSLIAGLNPRTIADIPNTYLAQGPIAWLALLIMPCGWLGPIIGLNILRRKDNGGQFLPA